MMSQILTSMNVLKHGESRARTGAHGRLDNDLLGWPTTPDPSLIPQYRPPLSEDDGTYMKPPKPHVRYSHHVRLLAARDLISSGLLTHYSLPVTFQMFLVRVWSPLMLRHGFLMQTTHSCITLVTAKI